MAPPGTDTEESEDIANQEGLVDVFHYRGKKRRMSSEAVQPFTYGAAASLSSSDLHRFRTHNTTVARAMAARLSLFVRMEFTLELESVETMTFQKFVGNAPTPCHMVLFKIEPLSGIGVLDFSPPLGLAVSDRMLGGSGFGINPDRPLKEVEHALLNQAAQILTNEWSGHWKTPEAMNPRLLGFEINPKYLTTSEPEDEVYVLKYEASIGDTFDRLQLVLPVKMCEPLVRYLTADTDVKGKEAASKSADIPDWNAAYDTVKVPVNAVWSDVELLSRDLINFKVGDFLPIDSDSFDQVEVRLADKTKFQGRLGSKGQKAAVEITKFKDK